MLGIIDFMRIAVIADDMTGALDTGVQFKMWGMTAEVAPTLDKLAYLEQESDVVVVNTDSRKDRREEAYSKVREAVKELKEIDVFYKKVDSTLRGNIGSELEALMECTGESQAIMAPAFPQAKRATLNGHQMVKGKFLNETEYADDMGDPESFIPRIINEQTQRKTNHIPLEIIRGDQGQLEKICEERFRAGDEIMVLDAEYEKDLLRAARLGRRVKILSGSAGLASQLPEGLGLRDSLPTLTLCGSLRTTSRIQVANLERRLGAIMVILDVERMIDPEIQRICHELGEALSKGRDAILITAEKNLPVNCGPSSVTGDPIGVRLSEVTDKLLKEHPVSGIIITGGATAMGIFEKLGVESMEILGEVQSGIPLRELSNGVKAVTKAGGFGSGDALIEAVKNLRRITG
jgi:uncharacterized protein YgbK (DUF1537 family)